MRKTLLASAVLMSFVVAPALANPLLVAINEQPKCAKAVNNSNALRIGMKRVGDDGVRLKIRKSKSAAVSNSDFRQAKAAYTACMKQKLATHSIVLK